jgi:hypothetical protein
VNLPDFPWIRPPVWKFLWKLNSLPQIGFGITAPTLLMTYIGSEQRIYWMFRQRRHVTSIRLHFCNAKEDDQTNIQNAWNTGNHLDGTR